MPSIHNLNYSKIIHIFSFSKVFGMPGWRVGYLLIPNQLTPSLRKVQDAHPTHTSIPSQILALHCLKINSDSLTSTGKSWIQSQIDTLISVREAVWSIVSKLGTVHTNGAFYFLVPLPPCVSEDEAIEVFVNISGILLMHGRAFGAPGYLRLSYGSIPPERVLSACEKLNHGVDKLLAISQSRLPQVHK